MLRVWLIVAGILGLLSWQLAENIKARGELEAQLETISSQSQSEIKEAQNSAAEWEELYRSEIEAKEAALEREAERERERIEARRVAEESTAKLAQYIRSSSHEACINQPVPAPVDRRLLDATGAADSSDEAGSG